MAHYAQHWGIFFICRRALSEHAKLLAEEFERLLPMLPGIGICGRLPRDRE